MLLRDTVQLGDARLNKDGYLVAEARVARVGVQLYAGFEVGKTDMEVVRVYRPEGEVFHKDALASFAHRPITNDHPSTMVTAENWRDVARGHIGDEVVRDGSFVKVPLILMDKGAIDALQAGKRELSAGYDCELKWEAGTTPDGQAYDAQQTNIRINHVALVDRGRAGSACRIGDDGTVTIQSPEPSKGTDMTLQKVTVDGITVEMSDTAAQVVSKVQSQLDAANKAIQDKDTELGRLKAEHATALQTKDGEITALKAQIPDAAKLDALAVARAEIIGQAKAVIGDTFDAKGKTDVEIRKAVVAHALGDAAKDMTDAEIGGAFKVVVEKAPSRPTDPVRDVLRSGGVAAADPSKAFDSNLSYLTSAWKGDQQKGAA